MSPCSKKSRAIYLVLPMISPLPVAAAEAAVAGPSFPQAFRVVLALLLVLGLVVILASFFRKMNFVQAGGKSAINVLATIAVSGKERLLLVQVGEDQILISQGHGNIRKLHTLTHHVDLQDCEGSGKSPGFQGILAQLLERKD